jgi:hypothetical protein
LKGEGRKDNGYQEPAGAMEMYMVNKMTKVEKFNIILRYNRLFHKVVHIFKDKVTRDLT